MTLCAAPVLRGYTPKNNNSSSLASPIEPSAADVWQTQYLLYQLRHVVQRHPQTSSIVRLADIQTIQEAQCRVVCSQTSGLFTHMGRHCIEPAVWKICKMGTSSLLDHTP